MTTNANSTAFRTAHLLVLGSSLALGFIAATGCAEPISPEQGMFGETGEPIPDVQEGLIGDNECLIKPQEGSYGYKYQCNGWFLAKIAGNYNGDELSYFIPAASATLFGNEHEPYEHAKVMACCGGGYDPELYMNDQPQFAENCLMDFRQQACRSMAQGLKLLLESGEVPSLYKPKVTEIQTWLAQHVTECIDGLVDTHSFASFLQATWNLPEDGPWAPDLQDVHLEISTAAITDLHLPDDFVTCESLYDNDTEFFVDESQLPLTGGTWDVLLESGGGSLIGPVYDGGRVSGAGEFASLETSCTTPFCSTARLSEDPSAGVWALDELILRAEGDLVLTNGTDTERITDGKIELYTQAQGVISSGATGPLYTIPAHKAQFIVVGASGDVASLPLVNTTEISATQTGTGWSFAPFEIEYTDSLSNTWTLTVGTLDWL